MGKCDQKSGEKSQHPGHEPGWPRGTYCDKCVCYLAHHRDSNGGGVNAMASGSLLLRGQPLLETFIDFG